VVLDRFASGRSLTDLGFRIAEVRLINKPIDPGELIKLLQGMLSA
jgi:hypothetical protein